MRKVQLSLNIQSHSSHRSQDSNRIISILGASIKCLNYFEKILWCSCRGRSNRWEYWPYTRPTVHKRQNFAMWTNLYVTLSIIFLYFPTIATPRDSPWSSMRKIEKIRSRHPSASSLSYKLISLRKFLRIYYLFLFSQHRRNTQWWSTPWLQQVTLCTWYWSLYKS